MKIPKTWKNKDTHYLNALNSEWYKSLAIIQNEICRATYNFYYSKNMKTMFLPVTTNSISSPMGLGSDSLPVEIDLFNTPTYLADSMQFMLEYGCRYFEEGCFYLMPSFRGEVADQRHLCQFYHSEAEIPGNLDDVMLLIEEYIHYLCQHFLDNCARMIEDIAGTTDHMKSVLAKTSFPKVTFEEAIDILKVYDGCLRFDEEHGLTFITSTGESKLMELYGGIVWLTYMDKSIVPFYQASSEDHKHAKCADLLFGIGETVGCGERHATKDEVLQALKEHEVSEIPYGWYINMKDCYPMTTAGFGMGTERFILWLLKHDDIRDCQILPRFNGEIFIP